MHIYILPQCSTTAASVLNSAGMDAQFERSCCAISRGILSQLRHLHRNRQQQVIHETYTVHAWNRLADWAAQTLKPGARVYVKGYLTQKLRGDVVMTEVTAAQFFVQSHAVVDAENQLAS